jgi:signal transduction histidine kinase
MQVMKASQMASIGEMAACIAHDIKNPLACMSSALQVIDGEMGDRDDNKPIIKEVIDQIGRIDQSVKNILQYAKPESEQISIVDVDEILEHTLSLINKYASLKNVAVTLTTGAGGKKVQGGTRALQQLFFNICLNGIEAMEAEGFLTIVSRLRNDGIAGKDGRWVEVEIRDTGCGINNHDKELIFNPLFTTKERGTGLGLSISAKIVERYSGCIEVESALGQGSNFKISFPATAEG